MEPDVSFIHVYRTKATLQNFKICTLTKNKVNSKVISNWYFIHQNKGNYTIVTDYLLNKAVIVLDYS